MSQGRDWKEMLAELQAELEQDRKEVLADSERAWGWRHRISEVFNSKSANRFLPRLTKSNRIEFKRTAALGMALVNEIMEKILKKELSAQELNYIHAGARSHTPIDPLMYGLLQPVTFAAHTAWEMIENEYTARVKEKSDFIGEKEIAIFRQYLTKNPQAAEILVSMMPVSNKIGSAETIAQRLGRPVTRNQLQSLADDINLILGNVHNIRPVHVMQTLKRQFFDLPESQLKDDHFNHNFSMGGSTEVRAVLQEYAAVPNKPSVDGPALEL